MISMRALCVLLLLHLIPSPRLAAQADNPALAIGRALEATLLPDRIATRPNGNPERGVEARIALFFSLSFVVPPLAPGGDVVAEAVAGERGQCSDHVATDLCGCG